MLPGAAGASFAVEHDETAPARQAPLEMVGVESPPGSTDHHDVDFTAAAVPLDGAFRSVVALRSVIRSYALLFDKLTMRATESSEALILSLSKDEGRARITMLF